MSLLMRLSGYSGPVRASKANRKQIKEEVFPTIMTYCREFITKNPDLFTKPYVTTGFDSKSAVVKQDAIDKMSVDEISKLYLHDFLTGPDLIKLIIKRHNESGFAKQDDEA
jgi:hypothetical protein